jgi:hypothetical protein
MVNIPQFLRVDFAQATSTVLMTMSWLMVAAAVLALVGLPRRDRGAQHQPSHSQGRPATLASIG